MWALFQLVGFARAPEYRELATRKRGVGLVASWIFVTFSAQALVAARMGSMKRRGT